MFSLRISAAEIADETVDIEIVGNSVSIINNNIYTNCCSAYESDISIIGNTITIVQRDTSTQKCKCNCLIDLKHNIAQLKNGKFELIIYREQLIKFGYDKDEMVFIYKDDFTISGESKATQFFSSFEQTPCKSTSFDRTPSNIELNKVEVFPNPATSAVTIRFPVTKAQRTEIKLFNFLGKEIKSLNLGFIQPGVHTITLDAGNIPSGMYLGKVVFNSGNNMSFRVIWSK